MPFFGQAVGNFLVVLPKPSVVKYPLFHIIRKHHGSELLNEDSQQRQEPRKASEHCHTFADVDIRRACQKAKHFCNQHLQARRFSTGVKL